MSDRSDRIVRAIKEFTENPFVNMVKGVVLLLIGLSDASHTFMNDVTHGHVRVGHGLILIGLFSILEALPHLVEGLDASARYVEFRKEKKRANEEGRP